MGKCQLQTISRREMEVPGAGLEPAQPIGPGDFKSPVTSPPSPYKYSDLGKRGKSDPEIITNYLEKTGESGGRK